MLEFERRASYMQDRYSTMESLFIRFQLLFLLFSHPPFFGGVVITGVSFTYIYLDGVTT